ncbi:MAG: CAP domain-containing protein [Spirochaetales bacterium]|nr:CAP domain-containing protein [Spirochaetales bacterium]
MKLVRIIAVVMVISFSLYGFSLNDPTEDTKMDTPDNVSIPSGGTAELRVAIIIPTGNYIFIEHLSEDAPGLLTTFTLKNNRGIILSDIKKPEGKKQKNEVILDGKGIFTLMVADTKGHAPGTEVKGTLEMTTQLCSKNKGVCYMPRTFTKEIILTISNTAWTWADYEKYTYKTFAELPEANKRIDFKEIDYPLLHAAIFYETNRQRVLNNRKVFLHSPALEKAAKAHSDDMVTYKFFSHTSPVKGKKTMTQRLALVGIVKGYKGENIADTFGIEYKAGKSVYSPDQNGGYFSYSFKGKPIENHTYLGFAKDVLVQWMNSPGHRKNILDQRFTYLGTGAAHYNNAKFFNMDNFKSTQNFGSISGPLEKE